MSQDIEPQIRPEGIGSLISGLIEDAQNIARGEVQLVRAEVREEAMSAGVGGAFIAAGAVSGLFGAGFLLQSATHLLSRWLPRWAATGAVGLALTGGAAALGMSGKNRLRATRLMSKRAIESLRQDRELLKDQVVPEPPQPKPSNPSPVSPAARTDATGRTAPFFVSETEGAAGTQG